MLMALIAAHLGLAVCAPLLARVLGQRTFLLAASDSMYWANGIRVLVLSVLPFNRSRICSGDGFVPSSVLNAS